jgi:hypothetical protein
MVPDARESRDDLRDPRQRPQIRAEPLRGRAGSERPFDHGHRRGAELRFAPGPPRALQPQPAPALPRMVPVVRTDPRHAELLGHRRLRFASREQPRGLQPARFQRGKIPSGCGHASACDRTRRIS